MMQKRFIQNFPDVSLPGGFGQSHANPWSEARVCPFNKDHKAPISCHPIT